MVSPATRRGDNRGGGDRPPGGDRRGGRGGRGRDREQRPREDDSGGFTERVVHTRRISKVVKGGRRLRFNALVVVGDGQGHVGAGMGKALAIPDAVRKGNAVARRSTVTIPLKGSTIPHAISVRKGASIVIIKPAPPGTGVIAAGAMRAMLELGGVQDVVGKSLGSRNPINIVQATMAALSLLRDPVTERAIRMNAMTRSTNGATATTPPANTAEPTTTSSDVAPPATTAAPAATTEPATTAEPTTAPDDVAPAVATEPIASVSEPSVSEPTVAAANPEVSAEAALAPEAPAEIPASQDAVPEAAPAAENDNNDDEPA